MYFVAHRSSKNKLTAKTITLTRKTTGSKSLRLKYWDINQAAPICQNANLIF